MDALDDGFRELTLQEVGARLTAGDVIWAPMLTPAEVVADPMAQAAGCFVEVEDATGAKFLAPASPARLPGQPLKPTRPAPGLGQHTREVLGEAGYSETEIDALVAEGAVV